MGGTKIVVKHCTVTTSAMVLIFYIRNLRNMFVDHYNKNECTIKKCSFSIQAKEKWRFFFCHIKFNMTGLEVLITIMF
jgi:hypothetical protein